MWEPLTGSWYWKILHASSRSYIGKVLTLQESCMMDNDAIQVFVKAHELHTANQAKIIAYQKLLKSPLLVRAREMLEKDQQRLNVYERQVLGVVA